MKNLQYIIYNNVNTLSLTLGRRFVGHSDDRDRLVSVPLYNAILYRRRARSNKRLFHKIKKDSARRVAYRQVAIAAYHYY